MSDLAPFVAATLRDKVVEELKAENESLRQQLDFARRIEIVSGGTGEDGPVVVHAEGQLQDGHYISDGLFFDVALKPKHIIALRDLSNVRICVGGIQTAEISDFTANLHETQKGTTKKDRVVPLGDTNQLLHMTIHGWKEDHVQRIVGELQRGEMSDSMVLPFILEYLPRHFPDATVSFQRMWLDPDSNKRAIQNLPASVLTRINNQVQESKAWEAMNSLVIWRMEENGYEKTGPNFQLHLDEVHVALQKYQHTSARIVAHNTNKDFFKYLDTVVQLHKVSVAVPGKSFDDLLTDRFGSD